MSIYGLPLLLFTVEDDEDLGNQITYPIYSWLPSDSFEPIVRSLKIEGTETVIELGFENNIVNGTPKSLRKLSDNTAYSVTSGKTAKLIVIAREVTASSAIELIEDSSADAGTGTIKHTTPTLATLQIATIVVDSIAESKFVTLEPNVSGDSMQIISAVAIES